MSYFMGIDLGGTVVKASVFDAEGTELGTSGRRTTLVSDVPGQAERSIEETRRLALEAIREALQASGVDGSKVSAVGTTGHGKGVYTLDKDGNPDLGVVSTDTRSIDVSNRLLSSKDFRQAIYSHILQPLWPAHTATILTWLKETHRATYDRIGTILFAKDVLRYILTGTVATEKTDVSGSGLWNNREDRLDEDVLRRLGIEEMKDAVPEVFESHQVAGKVQAEVAAATGLSAGTPVVGGIFDVNGAALATGLRDPDELAAVVGTWSISEFVSDDVSRVLESDQMYVIQAHCVPGQWMVHEASPTSASNLEWFTQSLLPDIPEKERFDYCNDVVSRTPETGVTFFPFIFGDDLGANATGTMWGLRPGTGREEIIRAIYESIVFQHARHLNRLLEVMETPRRIRFAGGATRSEVWMRMFADVLGIPVAVSPATELGALGAAICAAVGVGEFDGFPAAMEAMTGIRETYEPNEAKGGPLREKQARFDEAVHDMAGIWRAYG
jgi:L-xylulokinase